MFNENFSHGKKFNFNSDGLIFITLDQYVKDFGNKSFTVREVFINPKSKFGPRACVVSDTHKINLPKHFNSDVEKITNNQQFIDAINNGKCGFQPEQYTDRTGVVRNSGKFIDI